MKYIDSLHELLKSNDYAGEDPSLLYVVLGIDSNKKLLHFLGVLLLR